MFNYKNLKICKHIHIDLIIIQWYYYKNNVVVYTASKEGHSVVFRFKVDEETEEFTVESLTLDGIESLYMLDTVLYDIYNINYY